MPKEKLPKEITAKIHKLEKDLKESLDARKRLAADYANLERRIQEEREQLTVKAGHQLLEKLFPIFDNFYRASSHAPVVAAEDAAKLTDEELKKIFNYFEGLKMVEHQMESVLGEAGLKRIATKGEVFDHNLHEAISYEENSEVPEDHIIDEIEAGWQIDGHVLKPAKVRVSKG
jgi:molecular chaperone GrpE